MAIAALSGWTSEQKHVVAASFLGWSLDAFDFFLLVFVLKDIAEEFHTDISNVTLAILLTLAMRPIGAFIFGRAADRWGRRPTLMIDILLYSILEFASGFAPSLTVLIILRALYGVAMGGEWGVGASLTMETIPPHARGFVSGLLQSGYPAGYFMASIVYALLFPYIGWRGMFMVGVIPALLVSVYPSQRSGIAKLEQGTGCRERRHLGGPEIALAARNLRGRADDGVQFLQPRNPGYLSDIPAGGAQAITARRRHHRGDLQYRRHLRRHSLRHPVRAFRKAAMHRHRVSAVACRSFRSGRSPNSPELLAVGAFLMQFARPGRLGRRARASERAVAG